MLIGISVERGGEFIFDLSNTFRYNSPTEPNELLNTFRNDYSTGPYELLNTSRNVSPIELNKPSNNLRNEDPTVTDELFKNTLKSEMNIELIRT